MQQQTLEKQRNKFFFFFTRGHILACYTYHNLFYMLYLYCCGYIFSVWLPLRIKRDNL